MKRITTILSTLLWIIICVSSCASKEQKISEGILKESLKAPSTYKFISFEQESIWTMGSELEGRISLYKNFVESDIRSVEWYTGQVEDAKDDLQRRERDRQIYGSSWDSLVESSRRMLADNEQQLLDYKAKLERDQHILDVLTSLSETEDLTKETGRVYILTYEAQNSFGVPLKSVFRTHFKSNGELVEYKSENESWVPVGNVFSIPGYYELIGVEK